MSRLLARAYLTVTILALLAITVFFFWRLSSVRAEQTQRAAVAFQTLSRDISDLWQSEGLPQAGRDLSERLRPPPAPPTDRRPLVVGVYSFDDGIDYLWAEDGRFLGGVPDAAAAAPRIESNDLVHQRFSRSFELPDGRRRIVTAVYPVLDTQVTYPVLRDTLVALLGYFAVGLTVALVHSLAAARRRQPDSAAAVAPAERDTAAGAVTTDEPALDGTAAPPDEPQEDGAEDLGLMPLEGLEHRISLELERAGFHDQDLSVAFIAFQDVRDGALAYRNAQAVLSFFTFDDLCFDGGVDHKNQVVAILFPSTSLQEALGQIERFQRFYWEERHSWGYDEADFHCGVSARNGRLVEAQRIVRECRAALRRAAGAPGRIMGFHPDPQRYRSYLSGHSS